MEKKEILKLENEFNKIYCSAKITVIENDWMEKIYYSIQALKKHHNIE